MMIYTVWICLGKAQRDISIKLLSSGKNDKPNSKEDMELLREVLKNNHFDDEDE